MCALCRAQCSLVHLRFFLFSLRRAFVCCNQRKFASISVRGKNYFILFVCYCKYKLFTSIICVIMLLRLTFKSFDCYILCLTLQFSSLSSSNRNTLSIRAPSGCVWVRYFFVKEILYLLIYLFIIGLFFSLWPFSFLLYSTMFSNGGGKLWWLALLVCTHIFVNGGCFWFL